MYALWLSSAYYKDCAMWFDKLKPAIETAQEAIKTGHAVYYDVFIDRYDSDKKESPWLFGITFSKEGQPEAEYEAEKELNEI